MTKRRVDIEGHIRAGDTEPLEIKVDANGLDNLADFNSGKFYARLVGATMNHVDGAPITVLDSAGKVVAFDPVGNGPGAANAFAIGDEGDYDVYVEITWDDLDRTRHPGSPEMLRLTVGETFE